ncbi:hypothetical protein [Modestobacter italicus]|uniref:hypothetical protein n=1 Tax=Modestobacter italicus (strain DSM 44449 / CECT 9708 / BC 501) TaxID=2732864 RepID=UPI001C985F14|nr:hypothetical protein [Modestobacter italicus]
MILTVVVACEIGFWVAVLAGLAARYLLRARRLSTVLLLAAPVIDAVLLVATALHLRSGATASWEHGLAALYIGFSVAYGHRLVQWADVRFAHRFAGGPAPVKPTGAAYTRACWADVGRTLLAALVAGGVLAGLVAWVDAPDRTAALSAVYPLLAVIVGIELLWAVSYTIWPKAPAQEATVGR